MVCSMYRALFVPPIALTHSHTHTYIQDFIGDDEAKGLREGREREKQSEMVPLIGLDSMIQFQMYIAVFALLSS